MGVLEDAIREHLALKRRHGVAEEEVRRQEAEALGPARREPEEHAAAEGAPERAPHPPEAETRVVAPEDATAVLLEEEPGGEREPDEVPAEESLGEPPSPEEPKSTEEEDRLRLEPRPARDFDFE